MLEAVLERITYVNEDTGYFEAADPSPGRQTMRQPHLAVADRVRKQVQAIMARNLASAPLVSDLLGSTGRHWLSGEGLPVGQHCYRGREHGRGRSRQVGHHRTVT